MGVKVFFNLRKTEKHKVMLPILPCRDVFKLEIQAVQVKLELKNQAFLVAKSHFDPENL